MSFFAHTKDFVPRESNATVIPRLKKAYSEEGCRSALALLNSLCGLRFTSLYRFTGETLRNITFYDREYPEVNTCDDIPVLASYCVFVRDSGAPFKTENAKSDERAANHPKQETIQTRSGFPCSIAMAR